jgi:hypothetical protein
MCNLKQNQKTINPSSSGSAGLRRASPSKCRARPLMQSSSRASLASQRQGAGYSKLNLVAFKMLKTKSTFNISVTTASKQFYIFCGRL